jgi:hypothetical protein
MSPEEIETLALSVLISCACINGHVAEQGISRQYAPSVEDVIEEWYDSQERRAKLEESFEAARYESARQITEVAGTINPGEQKPAELVQIYRSAWVADRLYLANSTDESAALHARSKEVSEKIAHTISRSREARIEARNSLSAEENAAIIATAGKELAQTHTIRLTY